jgi:hypothetical protein
MIGRTVEGNWGAYMPVAMGVVNGVRTTDGGREIRVAWDAETFADDPIDHGWYRMTDVKVYGADHGIGIYWGNI